MGVKIALRRSGGEHDDAQTSCAADQDVQPVPHSVPCTTVRASEKSQHFRRNKGEKSVLDDIMGDLDDFQDFGDLDVGSDSESGRWKEACKIRNAEEEMFLAERLSPERMDYKEPIKDSSIDRENASIVDLYLTECKHDAENCEDPGSTSYKENEQSFPVMADEKGIHPFNGVGNLGAGRNKKLHTTRYFIIKSLSHQNIQLSIEKGVWATQVMNEPILGDAFHNSDRVILIFSVNMSGFFQGYAQMMSPVGWRRDNVWSESSGGNNPWGRTFNVRWLRLHNLPFQKTLHLKNPLNDYKPVKISRDCQELTPDVGEALCALFDGKIDFDGKQKRTNVYSDDFLVKRPCRESSVPLPDEDYLFAVPSSPIAWTGASIMCPLLYQHAVTESHNPLIKHGSASGEFMQDSSPAYLEVQKSVWMKHSHIQGKPMSRQVDMDVFSRVSSKDVPDGRHAVVDSLSEEDILDMTYEEYLRVHGRSNGPATHQQDRLGLCRGLPASTSQDDDQYSIYLSDWYRSQKRTINGYNHLSY